MSPTVIVARPNDVQRHCLATVLRLHGFEVIEADGGPAALEAADRVKVDVLVADLLMPGMNGLELGRRLREASPDAAVLITSEWDLSQRHLDLAGGSHARLLPRLLTTEALVGTVRRAARKLPRDQLSRRPRRSTETPAA